jgi:hypothetical protein
MLPTSNCEDNKCPGWLAVMILGLVGYIFVTVMFWKDVYAGEVRVEITRELPEEKQLVVQHFYDEDSFMMWMATKMEGEGCDPYVSEIKILRNYEPKDI